jgi:hypothetical protein
MNCSFSYILKAALINAAFLFSVAEAKTKIPTSSIENIRGRVSQLLATDKKTEALQILSNFIKADRNKAYRNDASELLFSIGQVFLNKETQEHYEASLNETLSNDKLALKAAERCLKLDAVNLDCLIQKARSQHRLKNSKAFGETLNEIRIILTGSNYEKIFEQYVARLQPENKSKQVVTTLPTEPNEKTILFLALELERAFFVKNYSRAKDVIIYSEKHFADWPDLAYFKNKLNLESSENQLQIDDDLKTIYINKCKSISKSYARKFRYDFDLCNREENVK